MPFPHLYNMTVEVRSRYKAVFKNYWKVMFDIYRTKRNIKVICRDGYEGIVDPAIAMLILDVFLNSDGKIKPTEVMNFLKSHSKRGNINDAYKLARIFYGFIKNYKGNYYDADMIDRLNKEEFPYKDKIIRLHGIPENGEILDVYISEDYKFLSVNNEVVVDVGANIADSSIYFAISGARKVIALEPFPYSYKTGKRNVDENGLGGIIDFINGGYGNGEEMMVDENVISNGGSKLIPSASGKKVKLYSLKEIVNHYNIDTGVLKMDCEGCEYNILNEDDETLRRFKKIQIEYHYGYRSLRRKFRNAGFNVAVTKSFFGQGVLLRLHNILDPKNKVMIMGYLKAELPVS